MRTKTNLLAMTVLLAASLAGCSPLVKSEQPVLTSEFPLNQTTSIGQSFTARYAGLQAISVFLKPVEASAGTVNMHLRSSPQDSQDIRQAHISTGQISNAGYYRFKFDPLDVSFNQDYFFFLTTDIQNDLFIASGAPDTYLNGSAYQDHTPQEAQLTFMLEYDPLSAGVGVTREALRWTFWGVICIFLFVLPGWGLFGILLPGWNSLHWAEKLALAGGLSLGIYPLVMLWTDLFGLRLGALYAWLPPLMGMALMMWKNRKELPSLPSIVRSRFKDLPGSLASNGWQDLALVAVIALIFACRLWVIRNLALPMWGDSYQHAVIVQLLVEHGGLFDSWLPYAEMTTFTYHFGFHSLAAVFHWFSGLDATQSILWLGQFLNGFAVICLFPLATRLFSNRWAAIATLFFAGLISSMPMFYVNWGRYTQLTAQAMLPVILWLGWDCLETKPPNIRLYLASWLALSGLAFTHYRVLFFAVAFYITLFLVSLRPLRFWPALTRIAVSAAGAMLLFLPWAIQALSGSLDTIHINKLDTPAAEALTLSQEINGFKDMAEFIPKSSRVLIPLALLWGIWKARKATALICLWCLVLFLMTNPYLLGLPGSGVITNFAIAIAAYLPISLLAGGLLGELVATLLLRLGAVSPSQEKPPAWRRIGAPLALFLAIALMGSWLARLRMFDVNPFRHALATRADLRAASWIEQNTPPQSRFLVNSFFVYGKYGIVGSDGGWWLPILAKRQTTLPPLVYLSEAGPTPNYRTNIRDLTALIVEEGINSPAALQSLRERGITHVYLGQQQGSVNSPGPLFSPAQLLDSPFFHLLYHQDRVWIFEIVQ